MSPGVRGAVVSVGYAPTLAITLVRNMRHLTECWVATSPEDLATQAVVRGVPGARLFITDAWTRYGAAFNKGLGFEELFDAMGRHGHILIHDADILFPPNLALTQFVPGYLHGARRRLLEDPSRWSPDFDWRTAVSVFPEGPIGFFQLFDAEDPAVRDRRPWYDVSFAHAGGGDAYFMQHWPRGRRRLLTTDVLHLGPRDSHWFGVDETGKRQMDAMLVRNGWTAHRPDLADAGDDETLEIVERVQVPGYAPSGFELR